MRGGAEKWVARLMSKSMEMARRIMTDGIITLDDDTKCQLIAGALDHAVAQERERCAAALTKHFNCGWECRYSDTDESCMKVTLREIRAGVQDTTL